MARNRSPALRSQFNDLRARYTQTRQWLAASIIEVNSIWQKEMSRISHLPPPGQHEQFELFTARMQKYFDLVPSASPGLPST